MLLPPAQPPQELTWLWWLQQQLLLLWLSLLLQLLHVRLEPLLLVKQPTVVVSSRGTRQCGVPF